MPSAIIKSLLAFCLSLLATVALASDTILVFGDSLSAGYGMRQEDSWPALLGQRLASRHRVANASVSGETTAGGLSRLPAALNRWQPTVVVIALGANDGLRGLSTSQMGANLTAMIRAARADKARVLLIGMKLPPNYGPAYARQFENTFAEVARIEKVPLLPFLLEPLGATTEAFQPDGLHPTAAAQPKILDHVWPALKPLLN
jgi:acyl-CoA thioesterase I